jgi:hypothetical protein
MILVLTSIFFGVQNILLGAVTSFLVVKEITWWQTT